MELHIRSTRIALWFIFVERGNFISNYQSKHGLQNQANYVSRLLAIVEILFII